MANAVSTFFQGFLHDIVVIVSLVLLLVLIYFASQRFTRTKGRDPTYHVIYAAITIASFLLLPLEAKDTIFTPLTVIISGTVFPIYESIRAVCTIETGDDTVWLTYWVVQGAVSFTTEWVDGLGEHTQIHWNMFEFFFYLWLLLPWTDGASLIFDFIFEPFVAPLIQPLVQKMDGVINKVIMALTNAAHLSIVWIAFVFLNPALKRVIWIMIGTIFPILSSIVSVTSPEGTDDTYWLTYWSCFGILFIITDFLESFLGQIPGFYTIIIAVTVYLMLPLFRGADVVSIFILLHHFSKHHS